MLRKKDRSLIAAHIAKGTKETQQLVDYHLKKLVEKGIVILESDFDTKYYRLQGNFYMEDAETALMKVLIPWMEEFAKQIEINEDMKDGRKQVVLNNLNFYLNLFLMNVKDI